MSTLRNTLTDEILESSGRKLALRVDIDLGELLPGHRVILRGIEKSNNSPANLGPGSFFADVDRLHYEHVPGLDRKSPTPDWILKASDDIGTKYVDDDGGAYDRFSGGPATHGFRDLGLIPPGASFLTLAFHPSDAWIPTLPWIRRIEICVRHLNLSEIAESWFHDIRPDEQRS